jgi:dihydrolipoamide dehydrogenase
MKHQHAEVAIIGAGTAGMGAYRAALAHTDKLVVVEGGAYGTTCARVGCMPSKLLIAAGDAAQAVRQAAIFGVMASPPRIDGRAVMQRVRSERDRFVGFVTDAVAHWPAAHRLAGATRFLDDHTLDVGGHTRLSAERIVIATGSSPRVPAAWRAALGDRLIVNDDVFNWQDLPASVAVVGAGVMALELAQALHHLGVRVRMYGRDRRLGPLTDPVLQALTVKLMAQRLPLQLDSGELVLARQGDQVSVRGSTAAGGNSAAGGEVQHFDWLLAATGRSPNVQQLGLDQTTLPLDPDGAPVFDPNTGQVGVSHVFMAGDATGTLPFLHEAADEGRIAGDNAGRFPDVRVQCRRTPLSVVFCDPQIAMVGQSHAALQRSGLGFEVGELSFEDQGRSRVIGKNAGMLRVYGQHGTGRLLGAEMIGPAAEHLGHLLAWSVQRGDTVQQMLDSPFYHPVIEEGLRRALRDLQSALHMGPAPVPNCLDCGPGG